MLSVSGVLDWVNHYRPETDGEPFLPLEANLLYQAMLLLAVSSLEKGLVYMGWRLIFAGIRVRVEFTMPSREWDCAEQRQLLALRRKDARGRFRTE